MSDEEYHSHKSRWLVWATAVFLNCFTNASWLWQVNDVVECSKDSIQFYFIHSYSPVTTQAAAYFETTVSGIDLFITAPNFIGMPISLMSTWIIDKIGLRQTILTSSSLVCAGAFIKCIVTFPGLDQNFDKNVQYWMTLCGQCLVVPGNVLAFCIPNKAGHINLQQSKCNC